MECVQFIGEIPTNISDVIIVYILNAEVIKESVPMVIAILILHALVAFMHLWLKCVKN